MRVRNWLVSIHAPRLPTSFSVIFRQVLESGSAYLLAPLGNISSYTNTWGRQDDTHDKDLGWKLAIPGMVLLPSPGTCVAPNCYRLAGRKTAYRYTRLERGDQTSG